MKKTKKKGFTLIELIVVIAILAVLAMILVPSLTGYIGKSKQAVANANARSCYTAGVAAQANIEANLGTDFDTEVRALMKEDGDACAFSFETEDNKKSKIVSVEWSKDGVTGSYPAKAVTPESGTPESGTK